MALQRPRTVMFHIGRSGSGVLGDLLDQHPDVRWDGEVVKPRRLHPQLPPVTRRLWPGAPTRARGLLRVVQRRMASAPRDRAYGFEIKFFHLDREGVGLDRFLDMVAGAGVDRYIVLRRRNLLRKVVSSLVAARAGTHHSTETAAGPAVVVIDVEAVTVDRDRAPLVQLLERWDRQFEDLDRRLAGRRVLPLTYEDDVEADPRLGYGRICDFLDVAPAPADVRLRPTNPFPLDAIVANLDDVREVLAGTRFAWMAEA